MDASNSIRREIFINASAAAIFPYLVDASRMTTWMGQAAELDATPGGLFRLDMNGAYIARGKFVEVEPGKRVVFTWGWEGSDEHPPGMSTVAITLTERAGGTLLELVHSNLPAGDCETHGANWEHFLGELATTVQGAQPS